MTTMQQPRRLRPTTTRLFDLFLDLPHPSSSSPSLNRQQIHCQRRHQHSTHTDTDKSNMNGGDNGGGSVRNKGSVGFHATTTTNMHCCNYDDGIARIIDPPVHNNNKYLISHRSSSNSNELLYSPTTIAQVTSLAFPEYDEIAERLHHEQQQQQHHHDGQGHLSKYDIYQSDFIPHQHSFTIALGSSGGGGSGGGGTNTKVFGHVRHYLPPLSSSTTTTAAATPSSSSTNTNPNTTTTTTTTSSSRIDVGRRKHRAMVVLTRASGGTEFYSSILQTAEAIAMQSRSSSCHHEKNDNDNDDDPIRLFLHALFRNHAALIAQYEKLRRCGLGLNFLDYHHHHRGGGGGGGNANTQHPHPPIVVEEQQSQQQSPSSSSSSNNNNGTHPLNPCEAAQTIMKENEFLFRIILDGIEFGCSGDRSVNRTYRHNTSGGTMRSRSSIVSSSSNGSGSNEGKVHALSSIRRIVEKNDRLQFYLPHSLQPGYDALPSELVLDDIAHPILPLLRCIKSDNFVRLLSALLCEVRIIFVSACTTRLSSCVRAASSSLAQGLLAWKHTSIPVVPPSMMKSVLCSENKSPFLVGILNNYAPRVRQLLGKSILDVLYFHLDSNEVMTLNMANPRWTVPDLLKKGGGKNNSASEHLARDLDEILKAEQNRSGQETVTGTSSEKSKEMNGRRLRLEKGNTLAASSNDDLDQRKYNRRRSNASTTAVRYMTLLERREYASSVDAAAAFGKLIRSSFDVNAEDNDDSLEDKNVERLRQIPTDSPMYSATSQYDDVESFVASSLVSEFECGEECIRSALTSFFVHMYGDMGMYLSESRGTFLLDRRKFLLRKEQLGEREGSPTHLVLQKLSASHMFAAHARGRVEGMSTMARDRSNIMPHHIPLFDVCSKYLTVHQLEFSLENVRRIVSKTVGTCTRHMAVERHVEIRKRALEFMCDNPLSAMQDVLNSCREYNTNLRAVMDVIWNRLNLSRNSRHILVALELLTKLLLEGPLNAVTKALDGIRIIGKLKYFSDGKNGDANCEIRQAASHLYGLLADLPTLFAVRRQIAVANAEVIPMQQPSWSNYIVSRLPMRVDGQTVHALFRPRGMIVHRRILYDDVNSFNAVIADASDDDASAIAALGWRGKKGFPMYQDQNDVVSFCQTLSPKQAGFW